MLFCSIRAVHNFDISSVVECGVLVSLWVHTETCALGSPHRNMASLSKQEH
jgi:hypothetical protein